MPPLAGLECHTPTAHQELAPLATSLGSSGANAGANSRRSPRYWAFAQFAARPARVGSVRGISPCATRRRYYARPVTSHRPTMAPQPPLDHGEAAPLNAPYPERSRLFCAVIRDRCEQRASVSSGRRVAPLDSTAILLSLRRAVSHATLPPVKVKRVDAAPRRRLEVRRPPILPSHELARHD
jgi:hypothetical protein